MNGTKNKFQSLKQNRAFKLINSSYCERTWRGTRRLAFNQFIKDVFYNQKITTCLLEASQCKITLVWWYLWCGYPANKNAYLMYRSRFNNIWLALADTIHNCKHKPTISRVSAKHIASISAQLFVLLLTDKKNTPWSHVVSCNPRMTMG